MSIDNTDNIMMEADEIVHRLLASGGTGGAAILDSCGVGHSGSHLLIAGIEPVEVIRVVEGDPSDILAALEECFQRSLAAVFTLSYDFGLSLESKLKRRGRGGEQEPAVYVALYESLLVHDYATGSSRLIGKPDGFDVFLERLGASSSKEIKSPQPAKATSNFTRESYKRAVDEVREYIRRGDTYQANLTQKFRLGLPPGTSGSDIFLRLRKDNPSPFAAFIDRGDSTVVSASPERFFRIQGQRIETSPIKGTRRRGATAVEDAAMRHQLITSGKDRAENIMIVDLLRNDLGRVCRFGSVTAEKLCELEEHPTLFHLVSTVSGELRKGIGLSEVIRAVFPCGSITGAPKIRTMEIIDDIEAGPRGLSMGAIGYFIPETGFDLTPGFDVSVAIRTMVVRGQEAEFNVGGGIVIDSDPDAEYEESLLKAKALFAAAGVADLGEGKSTGTI